jgi:hypothetical protein
VKLDDMTSPAEARNAGYPQVSHRRQLIQMAYGIRVDMHSAGAVANPPQFEPQAGARERADHAGGGLAHEPEQGGWLIHVVEYTQSDRDVMGVLLLEVLPSCLPYLDLAGIPGSGLRGQMNHGGCRVQTGNLHALLSQRRKKGTASAANVQHPPGPETGDLLDRQPKTVEYRSPAKSPGNRLAAVEAGEPAGPPVKVAFEISA